MNEPRPSARPALGWLLSLTVIGLVGSLWAPTAHAEATLTSSEPREGSTVEGSPSEIDMTFSEQIGPLNNVSMTCGEGGTVVALGAPERLADGLSLRVPLVSAAPAGTCIVAWSITAADGQPAGSGTLTFTVAGSTAVPGSVITVAPGGSTPTTTPTDGGATPTATATTTVDETSKGPLALFRLLSNFGIALLFGALVVIAIAWPEGIEYIITVRYLRSVWIFAGVTTYLFAGALAANIGGNGIGAALLPTSWGDLIDTTAGKAAFLRMVFVAISSFAVTRPERVIDPGFQLPALVPPGIAVATIAFSRETFTMFDYTVGIVHALAMAVWLGGLVLLTRVVLAGPGEEDLVHAVRGFARISTPAMWATVATGAVQLFRLDRGALGTSHGLTVILKTICVAVMVFVAVAARQFITGRLTRVDVMTAPLALRLRRALGIEALLGVVVIAITGLLLTMNPPGLGAAPLPSLDLGVVTVFRNEQIGVEMTVSFSQKVGLNDVRVELITVPPAGISGFAVDFIPPTGSSVSGMTINVPLTGPGAAELRGSITGFRLDTAGVWSLRVRVGTEVVATSEVQVNEATTVVTIEGTSPPGTTTPAGGSSVATTLVSVGSTTG